MLQTYELNESNESCSNKMSGCNPDCNSFFDSIKMLATNVRLYQMTYDVYYERFANIKKKG